MQKLAKIISHTTMKGISQRTQLPYTINELHVTWTETPPNTQPYESEMVMTVTGELNEEMIVAAERNGTLLPITFYLGIRTWNDRKYTDIHGYLPKDFMAPQNN